MLHFNQAMNLNAGNDHLLYNVFLTSLQGLALAWFHRLPRNSVNSFSEVWTIFISQYLCLVRQKRNTSSLYTIIKQEEETIWDFTRRFGQAIQQVEVYSVDAVLQNFRKSFAPLTLFFHLLSLDPPTTMEELYKWADKYSTQEDNIRSTT